MFDFTSRNELTPRLRAGQQSTRPSSTCGVHGRTTGGPELWTPTSGLKGPRVMLAGGAQLFDLCKTHRERMTIFMK